MRGRSAPLSTRSSSSTTIETGSASIVGCNVSIQLGVDGSVGHSFASETHGDFELGRKARSVTTVSMTYVDIYSTLYQGSA